MLSSLIRLGLLRGPFSVGLPAIILNKRSFLHCGYMPCPSVLPKIDPGTAAFHGRGSAPGDYIYIYIYIRFLQLTGRWQHDQVMRLILFSVKLLMLSFLIRSTNSQSSSYPAILTRLGGLHSRPNSLLKFRKCWASNLQSIGQQSEMLTAQPMKHYVYSYNLNLQKSLCRQSLMF